MSRSGASMVLFIALAAVGGCSSSAQNPASISVASTSAATSAASATSAVTDPTDAVTTTAPPVTTTSPALDCGALVGGVRTVDVAGVQRTMNVVVPNGIGTAAGPRRAPVIVLFHGFASTADEISSTTGLDHLAPDNGVVLIAPQAIGNPTEWHIGDASFGDTEFTDRVLELVRASPCIDPSAIWLAGFSAGSAWVGVYGCSHSDGLAGLLMHSGLAPPICPAASTPNLMIVHGTADPVVPFDGGTQTVDTASIQLQSVPESSAGWAGRAGCASSPTVAAVGDDAQITTWTGCAGGRTVSLQAVGGLGHTWSGGPGSPSTLNPACVLVQRLIGAADPVAACT